MASSQALRMGAVAFFTTAVIALGAATPCYADDTNSADSTNTPQTQTMDISGTDSDSNALAPSDAEALDSTNDASDMAPSAELDATASTAATSPAPNSSTADADAAAKAKAKAEAEAKAKAEAQKRAAAKAKAKKKAAALKKYKKKTLSRATYRYKHWKDYLSSSQKKAYKTYMKKIRKAKSKAVAKKYYKRTKVLIRKAKTYQKTYDPTLSQIEDNYADNHLTRSKGTINHNGVRETYYNLNMSTVCRVAGNKGYDGSYWVRADGCKMYGKYIILASQSHKYGTVLKTSLGKGIVLDYCGVYGTVDIATTW